MPTRRRLLVAFVACVAFGFVGVYMVWRPTAITWESFYGIRVGMTLEQVEAILGGPERDDGDGQWEFDVLFDQHVAVMGADGVPGKAGPLWDSPAHKWAADQVIIRLWFDPEGRVTAGHAAPVRRLPVRLIDRLRRWLSM